MASVNNARPVMEIAPISEYLLDSDRTLSYEGILMQKKPFRRYYRDSFRFSFQEGSLWVRCRIAAPRVAGKKDEGPVLVLANPILGWITLYVPVIDNGVPGIVRMEGGWRQDGPTQELSFLYPAFRLPGNIDPGRPLLIRVIAPFTMNFHLTLHTPESFNRRASLLFFIIGAFTGILSAMLLYNLVLYVYMRDRHTLFYILYIFFMLIWQVSLFGVFRYFSASWGQWFNFRVVLFALLMLFFGTIFAMVFLNTARTAPRHHFILKILAIISLAVALIDILGYPLLANLAAHFLAQFSTLAVFTASITAMRAGFRPARFYLAAVSVVLAAAIVYFLRFYGLLPSNQFTLHAVLYGCAAEAVLLSFALGNRIRLMREEEKILRLREKSLQAISVTDDLTGLYNRRFLNASLEKSIAAARRSGDPLSLLMIDVDHFKDFNDTFGHPEGDKVLAELGGLLTQTLRSEDVACRYGGEEFVVILHHTGIDSALEMGERIRSGFGKIPFPYGGGKPVHMTISVGAAQWCPEENWEEALSRADQALYRAKQAGRNRVCGI